MSAQDPDLARSRAGRKALAAALALAAATALLWKVMIEKSPWARAGTGPVSDPGVLAQYLWVAVGSALGGVARHWCTDAATKWLGTVFPWGTLGINILGSFVIGLFFTLTGADGRFDVPTDAKVFVMVGLCGGYTTFSAFSLQTLALAQQGAWMRAGAYVAASLVLCLLGVWSGYAIAAAVNAAGAGV